MDERDVVLAHEPMMAWVDPEPVLRDAGRIAREVLATLQGERARFAPRSGHPVAMMLDEWIGRLEAYAAGPLLPIPS